MLTESAESDGGLRVCSSRVNSNFQRHHMRHHPSEWTNFAKARKKLGQTTLTKIFQELNVTKSRMMALDDAIAHLISVDEEPLVLTQKQGLNHFMKVNIMVIIVSLIAVCYLLCALDICDWYP